MGGALPGAQVDDKPSSTVMGMPERFRSWLVHDMAANVACECVGRFWLQE